MRMPWHKSKDAQLDLLDAESESNAPHLLAATVPCSDGGPPAPMAIPSAAAVAGIADGRPMLVAVSLLYEDVNNPRTVFPEAALDELATDI